MRQHVRTHHKTRELHYSRAIQACAYCRSRRSKCDGQSPCDACLQRGIRCSYTRNSRRHDLEQSSRNGRTSPLPSIELDNESPLKNSTEATAVILRSEAIETSPCRIAPCVQAYFDKFHPIWPFLHPATFTIDKELPLLAQSVVMIGSWVMEESNSQQTAKDLHENLVLSIYEQKENWDMSNHNNESDLTLESSSFNPTPWPMATYQGILLHLIFSFILNNHQSNLQLTRLLPELPSRLIIALILTCEKRGLFYYPAIQSQFKPEVDPEVLIWLGIEEVKRFDLSLYRLYRKIRLDTKVLVDTANIDSSCGPRSSGRDLLSLADLQFALPDSDELWHMTSDLAANIAGNTAAYDDKNGERNWISQTARVLEPSQQEFRWVL
ncbi:uncharacterized protein N7503_003589 [Penicillium pulvis]|uniref:uncharacterized protein n=1 Tax=Penicillium pulvis TaxID=1562058 RepID=UPI002546F539|nr:uncharacterized protein N7503_003589 [Penicillium pulvis]KAJ5805987.1 hypothetical protein N7503_003589 [Penicillium pulvis]